MSQAVGREFMHADQAVGRVGKGLGGTMNPFAATRHVEDAIRTAKMPAQRLASGGSAQSFDTPLTPSEQAAFQVWKKKYAPNDTGTDYDLAGAFKAGLTPDPDRGHFPDTYKKPNHPTFSDESQYSTPDHPGGTWSRRDDHDVFTPSQYNLKNMPPEKLREYFNREEPTATLDAGGEGHASGGIVSLNPFAATHHVQEALRTAGQLSRGRLASGGTYNPPHPGFGESQDYHSILSPTAGGVIASEVPGRTDHIPTSVAADSFIIPADVVSGIGEGNTLAGARLMQEFLSTGPYGTPLPRGRAGGSSIPRPPTAPPGGGRSTTTYTPHLAAGGTAHRAPLKAADVHGIRPGEVPVILAGGEMVVDPHVVAHHPNLGNLAPGDRNPVHYRKALNHGTKVLTQWVVTKRKEIANQMLKLPGPRNS